MSKKFGFCTVALLVILSACSTVSTVRFTEQKLGRTNPASIRVYFHQEKPTARYTEIGSLAVGRDGNLEKTMTLFLENAAKMGADAVIHVEAEIVPGFWSPGRRISGTAIKFTN